MFTKLRFLALSLLAFGSTVTASASSYDRNISVLDVNFAQTYALTKCPASAPTADACLAVTGVADSRETGRLEFKRLVLFNPAQYDPLHPTCITGETSGTLTLPRGTLTFRAPGNICLIEGIASYDLIITGGTGAYAGALGSGKIVVPPPQTSSTGRELWHLELFKTDRNDYRFK